MIPSRYEHYMDIAGQVAKTTAGQEYMTVGGICLLPDTASVARERCRELPKWRDSDFTAAMTAIDLINGMAIVALTQRVRKVPNLWNDFWVQSSEYYRNLAQTTRTPKKAAFTKAATLLRYIYFGECSARMLGETIRHVGYPTIRDAQQLSTVQLRVVIDTDIQGSENIEMFNSLWERLEGSQPTINQLGLSERVSEIVFLMEDEEPLLLLSDHLAGAIHATTGPTHVPRPRGLTAGELQQVADAYRALPNFVAVNVDFKIQHKDIFREHTFGQT